jgi:hypothetical protein
VKQQGNKVAVKKDSPKHCKVEKKASDEDEDSDNTRQAPFVTAKKRLALRRLLTGGKLYSLSSLKVGDSSSGSSKAVAADSGSVFRPPPQKKRLQVKEPVWSYKKCAHEGCFYRHHWNPVLTQRFGKFCCGLCSNDDKEGQVLCLVASAENPHEPFSHKYHGKKCEAVMWFEGMQE